MGIGSSLVEGYRRESDAIASAGLGGLVRESGEERSRRLGRLLRPECYGDFHRYYFGGESGYHSCELADCHKRGYENLYRNAETYAFHIWSRQFGKTSQAITYMLGLKAAGLCKVFLVISLKLELARNILRQVRFQLLDNVLYERDFGKQRGSVWTQDMLRTRDGCYFIAAGVDSPIRGLLYEGMRVDFILLDDLEDRKEALNPTLIQARVDKIQRDIGQSFGQRSRRLLVTNNLTIEGGLIERLLTEYRRRSGFYLDKVPIRDKEGRSNWPGRWSVDAISKLEASEPAHVFYSEYMHEPQEVGRIFTYDDIDWVDRAYLEHRIFDRYVIYWDMSYTDTGDYKAGVLVGYYGGHYYVLRAFCRKCGVEALFGAHYEWVGFCRSKGWYPRSYYDASVSQGAVFRKQWIGYRDNYHPGMFIPNEDRLRMPKRERIIAILEECVHSGNLHFVRGVDERDMRVGVSQLIGLEIKGKGADDFGDALSNAIRILQGGSHGVAQGYGSFEIEEVSG